MAYYVNIEEWKPEQVADWMRGLDDALLPYSHYFINSNIDGQRLLTLTVDDFIDLHVDRLGHQELLSEAVDLLTNFHYNLDKENLQFIALKLGSKARSLYNELKHTIPSNDGKPERVTTATLSAVGDVILSVKDLISWLDRTPFQGQEPYFQLKSTLLRISVELATNAQRDLFAEEPVEVIKQACQKLAALADNIIQDYQDPLILQPASLDVATIKKKPEDDLVTPPGDQLDYWVQGMHIQTSYNGIHVIGGVKFQSPAHQCGKIEEGDEIVQVNYQTVVGWQQKKLRAAMLENPTKIILTLKKRPRHSTNFGQIYVKPYRLPSKKRDNYFRWHEGLPPSPRPDILIVPPVETVPPPAVVAAVPDLNTENGDSDVDDDSFLPEGDMDLGGQGGAGAVSPTSVRLYLPKPRLSIQRRATVTGASPTSSRPPLNIEQFWKEIKREHLSRASNDSSQGEEFPRPHSSVDSYIKRSPLAAPSSSSLTSTSTSVSVSLPVSPEEESALIRYPKKERSPKLDENIRPVTCIGSQTQVEARADHFVKKQFEGKRVASKEDLLLETSAETNTVAVTATASSPPARKISQERPKLDKSQSTPAYDVTTDPNDPNSFENKLQELKQRKTSRIEEAVDDDDKKEPKSPKPALPPRKDRPRNSESDTKPEMASSPSMQDLSNNNVTASPPVENTITGPATSPRPNLPPHQLGLRPQEIRDLIRRGLWPLMTQETPLNEDDKGLPTLTRVTRLNSNFQPVPGSTVPRIAPSLLAYQAATVPEEEVHVHLPPPKSTVRSPVIGTIDRNTGGRRVACKELGEGDHQGWLYRRRQARGFLSGPRWIKRWFVLKKSTLYGYRDTEDQKAESLICLPGFSGTVATEVKSKKFAFKLFNASTTFYFACETQQELEKWLSTIAASVAHVHTDSPSRDYNISVLTKSSAAYYSETDEESVDGSDGSRASSRLAGSPMDNSKSYKYHRGSNTLGRSTKPPDLPPSQGSPVVGSSLDRKYLRFLRSPEKQPVPTSQYRSYRKPPTPNSPTSSSVSLSKFYVPNEPDTPSSPTRERISISEPKRLLSDGSHVELQRRPSLEAIPTPPISIKPVPKPRARLGSDNSLALAAAAASTTTPGVKKSLSVSGLPKATDRKLGRRNSEYALISVNKPPARRYSLEGDKDRHSRAISEPPTQATSPRKLLPDSPGYAKIKPRSSTSSLVVTSEKPKYNRIQSRRSSGDSNRSSTASLSKLTPSAPTSPLPKTPQSPLSPWAKSSGGAFFGEGYREGSPDSLWINSLRSSAGNGKSNCAAAPALPPKPKVSHHLKHAGAYQPISNFPGSKKEKKEMRLAFEMNLDTSIPNVPPQKELNWKAKVAPVAKDEMREKPSKFRLFSSPKVLRKVIRGDKVAPEKEKTPGTLATNYLSAKPPSPKTLLGSPRLHRAIFGSSSREKKQNPAIDSSWSNIELNHTSKRVENLSWNEDNTSLTMSQSLSLDRANKRPPPPVLSSSGSSLYVPEELESCPGTPRTPIKPTMGVSMIGKQRRLASGSSDVFAFSPPISPSPVLSPKPSYIFTQTTMAANTSTPVPVSSFSNFSSNSVTPAEDLELEYPPVFEPGTYSLYSSSMSNSASTGGSPQVQLQPTTPKPAPRTKFLLGLSSPQFAIREEDQDVAKTDPNFESKA